MQGVHQTATRMEHLGVTHKKVERHVGDRFFHYPSDRHYFLIRNHSFHLENKILIYLRNAKYFHFTDTSFKIPVLS